MHDALMSCWEFPGPLSDGLSLYFSFPTLSSCASYAVHCCLSCHGTVLSHAVACFASGFILTATNSAFLWSLSQLALRVHCPSIYYKCPPVCLVFPRAGSADNLHFRDLDSNSFSFSQGRFSYCVLQEQIKMSHLAYIVESAKPDFQFNSWL